MTKKRNIYLAGLFNLISPGLGFLYVGKLNFAIFFPIGLLLLLGFSAWSKVIFTPGGFSGMIFILLGLWIIGVILASFIAYKTRNASLSKCQKWYFYLLFIIISYSINDAVIANRGAIYGYDIFRLPANSMSNTLIVGDFIISNTWKYEEAPPKRGDIIVFQFPKDPSIKYVKRIIGLPNDSVRINKGKVSVNGKVLIEPYVDATNNKRLAYGLPEEYNVPEKSYFVLGDNRDNSNDSRFWGYVPEDHIYGRVEFIWMSIDPKGGFRGERMYQNFN